MLVEVGVFAFHRREIGTLHVGIHLSLCFLERLIDGHAILEDVLEGGGAAGFDGGRCRSRPDQAIDARLDGGHDRLGEDVFVLLKGDLSGEGVKFVDRLADVIVVGEQGFDEVLSDGLLFLGLVLVDAWGGFTVVAIVGERGVLGEGRSGEDTVIDVRVLLLESAFHVPPCVNHGGLSVAETLGVVIAEIDGSDLVLVIQVLEELHILLGHVIVVVGFLAIGAEQQLALLIVQALIDGAVGVAVEIEAGLGHFAAVGLGELLGDLDKLVPCGRDVGIGQSGFLP